MGKKTNFTGETIAARVSIDEMIVDEYQGHVNTRLVDKIAKKWDEPSAGAVILNMRADGTYAVLDGQHRVLAAKKAGVAELNALVFVGKSRQEEARLFVQLNTKHNVMPFDKFKAQRMSGSKRENEIAAIVEELGLVVSSSRSDWKSVRSVQSLGEIYDNYGVAHLKTTLGTLHAAFAAYKDGIAWTAPALMGMAALLHRYPDVEIPRLIDRLSKNSPTTIAGQAQSRRAAFPGSEMWLNWGEVFTRLYNSGMRSDNPRMLPVDRWNKAVYTPKGREHLKTRSSNQKNAEHLKKYWFQKGVPHVLQPSRLAAAAKASK